MAWLGHASIISMKITIFYRYYWPDTAPYAAMLKDMTKWFQGANHDVEVITAQPGYKPQANISKQAWREIVNDGVQVRRLILFKETGTRSVKALNYAIYIIRSFFIVLLGPHRDAVMAGTTPPVIQAWLLSFAAMIRGSKFIYHMQDIHPEITSFKDGKMVKGPFFKLMQRMDIGALKRSSEIIVIGQDMADVIARRGIEGNKITVIRNFSTINEDNENSPNKTNRLEKELVRFVFAGNIGKFQNLESLVTAFAKLDSSKVRLVLVGEGRAKKDLIKMVHEEKILNVEFHDHMSQSEVFKFLLKQDVGLVSLLPGLYQYAFPSKIWTYVEAVLPMLAMVEDDSEIATFLKSNNFGDSINWNSSSQNIADAIMSVAQKVRNNQYSLNENKHLFHSSVVKQNWIKMLDELR